MALTKEQLLRPHRVTHSLALADFPEPLLLAVPSGALALRLREMQTSGVSLSSLEGITAILADMVADETGTAVLSEEESAQLVQRLSAESMTAIFQRFIELYAGKPPPEGAAPVPSKPSTSAE
jgi:hypothetical protein